MTGPAADPSGLDGVASACALLSNLFLRQQAGPATVANLDPAQLADWPLDRDPATTAGLELLAATLAAPLPDEEYGADWTQLFVGPGPMAACPWESVHRSEEGLTFEAETLAVRRAYAEVGLQAPAVNREPDDHIGLELAFVGELAVAALDAYDRGDTEATEFATGAAGRFVHEHLGVWGPGFADLVVEHARTDLYRAAGLLLGGSLPQFSRILPWRGDL